MGRPDETAASDSADPRGLESRVLLQRARARLLGRSEQLAFIGRYAITHRIGWGGMGVVYAAHDPDLDRDVAIKVLRHDVDHDPRRQAWLLREAQALAKLNHPNVVHVYEVGKYDDHVFLAMELVEGRTLRAWVRADRPGWREIVEHYLAAGRGLAAAHKAGVIHRDVKPDNLLLGSDGRVRVLDFGLAGLDPSASARASASASLVELTHGGSSDNFTAPGGVSGTPSYMAPEQHAGGELDAASDQFGFCVSLWEALNGSPPYTAKTANELAASKRGGPPPWPKPGVGPRKLALAVRRGLAADPDARWPGMDALLSALEDALSHRRRNRIALAVGGVALVAGSTALASWRGAAPSPCSGAQEQLGDAWSTARRESSQQAFAATGLSYADRSWERAAGTLDAYAAQWTEQHTDACEATRVRGEQSVELMDARIACLHASRRALAATTDLLAHADEQVVERADDLVASLPVVGRCGDVHALLDRIDPPEREIAGEVDELRDLVATATSFERAGKYDEAAAALAPAVDRAGATGYEPVQTEVNLLLGTIRERQGRYEESEKAHSLALQSGLRTGQWDEASRAATALVMTLGAFQRDSKRGLDFAPTAWGLIGRTSAPARSEAELRRVLGNVYRGSGELERAEAELRAALAIVVDAPGTDAIDVSGLQLALGSVLELRGDLDGARDQLEAAVAARVEHLGAEHPRTANARHNLAALLAKRGDFAKAETEYRAVLEIYARTHGPRHPTVAMTRSNLAGVLDETGHEEQAEAEKREVLEIFVEVYGPDHPHSLSARQNLAVTLGSRDKHGEAVDELRTVIARLEAKDDGRDPTIATVRLNLGVELLEMGRVDEAIAELRKGVDMRVDVIGETSLDAAEARTELARALLDHGRADEALPLARASWATFVKGDGPVIRRAWSAFSLARAVRATGGDEAEARRLAETARDMLEPGSSTRTKIDAWLRDRVPPVAGLR